MSENVNEKEVLDEFAKNVSSKIKEEVELDFNSKMSSMVDSVKSLSESVKSLSEKKESEVKKRDIRIDLSGESENNEIFYNEKSENELKKFKEIFEASERKCGSSEIIFNDRITNIARKSKYIMSLTSNQVQTKSAINTFSNDSMSYAMMNPAYLGMVDMVQWSVAPIIALSNRIVTTSDTTFTLGFDSTQVTVTSDQEAQPLTETKGINFKPKNIQLAQLSAKKDISLRMLDFQENSYVNIVNELGMYLEKATFKAQNDIAMKKIIDSTDITTLTTATANKISLDDIIGMTSELKRQYRMSPSFTLLINANAAAKLKTEVGNDGQYKWVPVLSDSRMSQIYGFDAPINVVVVDNAAGGFATYDKTEASNGNKIVGLLADLSSLGRQIDSTKNAYQTINAKSGEGLNELIYRTYSSYQLDVFESAFKIKVKA